MNKQLIKEIQQALHVKEDGIWGKQTQYALDAFAYDHNLKIKPYRVLSDEVRKALGVRPDRTIRKQRLHAHPEYRNSIYKQLPHSTNYREMVRTYGHPVTQVPYRLINLKPPYQLFYGPQKVKTIRVHKKAADSFLHALNLVTEYYSPKEISELHLNHYSGAYNQRRIRGGRSWSTHAFGCAIDFAAWENRLRWHSDRALFAKPEYKDWHKAWRRAGFVNLGTALDYDWMHFQLASI